jgi:hypothetical protein
MFDILDVPFPFLQGVQAIPFGTPLATSATRNSSTRTAATRPGDNQPLHGTEAGGIVSGGRARLASGPAVDRSYVIPHMAVTAQEAKQLLLSPELAAVEDAVAAQLGMRLIRDMAVTTYSKVEIDVGYTPLTYAQIIERLKADRDLLIQFHVALAKDAEAMDEKEEYAPGEEPDPEDLPRTAEVLGLGTGFGISDVVWFYFLRERPKADLTEFFKKKRTPFAAKFARAVRRIFDSAGGRTAAG